jgi:hypothetical protein
MPKILVVKYSGEPEPFSPGKLLRSMERAGATKKQAEEIVRKVQQHFSGRVKTRDIYRFAKKELRKASAAAATRYDLRSAMSRLGPGGYVFEQYVARLLEAKGYRVETNRMVRGHCVQHEIDVSAYRGKDRILVECKHHEQTFSVNRIQTALYVQARFHDLRKEFNKVLLVTNTKFSEQSKQYATCVGMNLLGWRFPPGKSIEFLVDRKRLWPITAIHGLRQDLLQRCYAHGVILISELAALAQQELQKRLGIGAQRATRLLREARETMAET